MNECKAIREALISRSIDLRSLLQRTLRLALNVGNRRVARWARQELNGYSAEQPLPEYRIIAAQSFVKLQGNQLVIDSILFPPEFIPADLETELGFSQMLNPVADYLPYLLGKHNDELQDVWLPQQLAHVNQVQRFMPGMKCIAGWKVIRRSAICEMVESCRDELLFALSEIEFGLGQPTVMESASGRHQKARPMLMVAVSGGVKPQALRRSA